MNPSKSDRSKAHQLTDLPNIGPATAKDLRLLGIQVPQDLIGKDPWELYHRLNDVTGIKHDPCVLDIFMSITDFMAGGTAQQWWAYTQLRKRILLDHDL